MGLITKEGPPLKKRAGLRRKQAGRGSYRGMGTCSKQALEALCCNTDWKYAVFWKFQHPSQMKLTWEDAYYNTHGQQEPAVNMRFTEKGCNLNDQHSHDLLGLAVAKMSFHVYSVGEGIVGNVAFSGKHLWTFADKTGNDWYSLSEHNDRWHEQFSAAVKTVAVVAVLPYGVVQIGSLNKIPEDLELVNHIRYAFFSLLDSSVGCTHKRINVDMKSIPCLSGISTRSSTTDAYVNRKSQSGSSKRKCEMRKFATTRLLAESAYSNYCVPSPFGVPSYIVNAKDKDEGDQSSKSVGDPSTSLHPPRSKNALLRNKIYNPNDMEACNYHKGNAHNSGLDDVKFQKFSQKSTDCRSGVSSMDPFIFSDGCELYGVVGPAFGKKKIHSDCDMQEIIRETTSEMPEKIDSCSLSTADSGSEHLLEAVVASACHSVSSLKNEKLSSSLSNPTMSTEICSKPCSENSDISVGNNSSNEPLVKRGALGCLSSEVCDASSSNGFPCRNHSTFSENSSGIQPVYISNKRARPNEIRRPRPRDRQLVEDRIRELRKLVPNGAKCSIDSLLNRTIKHTLFMKSITKNAEKLNKRTELKACDKKSVPQGLSSYHQGSSWAMEVGGPPKVCPIKVENISMSRKLLIEICGDCGYFLEIAQAIRSLDVKILKGGSEACGKKRCMHFVVEGQNNKTIHRLDLLWSLIQILQAKTIL